MLEEVVADLRTSEDAVSHLAQSVDLARVHRACRDACDDAARRFATGVATVVGRVPMRDAELVAHVVLIGLRPLLLGRPGAVVVAELERIALRLVKGV